MNSATDLWQSVASGVIASASSSDPRDRELDHDELEYAMQRRVLLRQTLAALVAGAIPALDVVRDGLDVSPNGRTATALDADEWASVAQDYERAYYTHHPETLILSPVTDLDDLRHCRRAAPEPVQRDLSRVAAQLAALMAMSLVNLGHFQPARRW